MKTLQLEGGGFPLNTKALEQLRDMAEQVAHVVSQIAGNDKVIVSGVEDQGADVYSAGWIVIGGELLPFLGGALGTHIAIVEAVEQAQYLKDDDNNGIGDFVDAYIERYATFSNVATDNHLFEDFERYENTGNVAKSGVLILNPSTNTATVTGDFVSAETLNPTGMFDVWQFYKVNFEDLGSDYDVMITPLTAPLTPGQEWYFNSVYYAIAEKSSSDIKISFRSEVFSSMSSIPGTLRFQISLIKKI